MLPVAAGLVASGALRRAPQNTPARAAWYTPARGGWLSVLHLPYTAWHLSYVLIGAGLAPRLHVPAGPTLLAFGLAVGLAAHLPGRAARPAPRNDHPGFAPGRCGGRLPSGGRSVRAVGIARVGWGLAVFIAVWRGGGPGLQPGVLERAPAQRPHLRTGVGFVPGADRLLSRRRRRFGRLPSWPPSSPTGCRERSGSSAPRRAICGGGSGRSRARNARGRPGGGVEQTALLAPLERSLVLLSWCTSALGVALRAGGDGALSQ